MRGIETIRKANPRLAQQIEQRGGFLLDTMLPELERIDRLMLVLVRCGNGRFMCPVQDCKHFTTIISEHAELKAAADKVEYAGDHVRDVSLPAD